MIKRETGRLRYQGQSHLFKALSHPKRLAILEIIRNGEECVCHLEAILGFRQTAISQQLGVLRKAGLVEDRRDSWNVYYRVVRPEINSILDIVKAMTGSRPVIALNPKNCTCPRCTTKRDVSFFE